MTLRVFLYFMLWAPLWVFRHVWWNWTITGQTNLRPYGQGMVLAVNHLNWTDTYILGASLPLSLQPTWIAKAELFANPLAAWWLRTIRVIPIKRGQRDLAALIAAEAALKQGTALVIFVEGHRSPMEGLQAGQGGAIRLAARTGCPIVPIAIWGTEAGLRSACVRKPIHVRIGEPYFVTTETQKISRQHMNELIDEMMLRLATLLPERYWGLYRERMEQLQSDAARA